MFKIINDSRFYDYIWKNHDKCIQISTNMPGIGLEICVENFEKQNDLVWRFKPMAVCKVLSIT